MGRREQDLVVDGAPLTFDGRLYPLELQEYPDGLVVGNLCDLRRGETRERTAGSSIGWIEVASRRLGRPPHLKNDTLDHFAVFLALLLGLPLEVLVHLSSAHHVLPNARERHWRHRRNCRTLRTSMMLGKVSFSHIPATKKREITIKKVKWG